jgi:hypothetical protein
MVVSRLRDWCQKKTAAAFSSRAYGVVLSPWRLQLILRLLYPDGRRNDRGSVPY